LPSFNTALINRRIGAGFLISVLGSLKDDQITRKPGQDRRSLLQVIQHIILGERGARGQGEAAMGRKLPRDDQQY